MKRFARAAVVAVLLPLSGACSMALSVEEQRLTAQPIHAARSGSVATAPAARGIDGKVGWGRATIFYIPVAPVHIEGDGNERVMATVREALALAGYTPEILSTPSPGKPVVTCKVEEFWFSNFTWGWPAVRAFGDATLLVAVERDGVPVWQREFREDVGVWSVGSGFSKAGNQVLGTIMGQMAAAFTGEDFYRAVNAGLATAEAPRPESAPLTATVESISAAPPNAALTRCTTDQVLSMKSSGLTDEQVKRACND
jgi:hypothetical protein